MLLVTSRILPVQVHCMDLSGSPVSSSQFSINGSGYENESIIVSDNLCFFYTISSCLPCHISWPLVCWACVSCGWEKARDFDHLPKLCCKLLKIHAIL